ncbi:MAG: hypothetical protein KJ556_20165 [Gammaproteobacteria bacterium]|nr:hypothetical protein [Gammaproteobacteria bacterium]MBU2249080.1 hypothetical protein [Gammaproteobacteria bacterium]
MNKTLAQLRANFRGQKGTIQTGYDNTPVPEGTYTCRVAQSELKEKEYEGAQQLVHSMRLSVEIGDLKGKTLWPWANDLNTAEGIQGCAKNIRAILGDVVPGRSLPTGEFELDYSEFLGQVEDLVEKCKGELVEVAARNSKKNREDGTPYQNIYINRGLGEDAASARNTDQKTTPPTKHAPGGSMKVGTKKVAKKGR